MVYWGISQMGLKMYQMSCSYSLPCISPPHLTIFYDGWEWGTPDLSISGTLALVLLSILHFIDSFVILEARTFHLGHAVFHRHWLEGGKKSAALMEAIFLYRTKLSEIQLYRHYTVATLMQSEIIVVQWWNKISTV